MKDKNQQLFDELRAINLPSDQYAIVASGPLGIRGLRDMSDIDILVTDNLWAELKKKYTEVFDHEASKLRVSPNIEAFHDGSFGESIPGSPTVREQIKGREYINGLPFQSIQTALYFKRLGAREKDIEDVKLIEGWLRENS